MNSLAYGFLVKHNMCRLQTEDRIPQKIKQNLDCDWLNLAQLGLPLCQFPKELLKAKYLATHQFASHQLHGYTVTQTVIFVIAKIDNGPE